MLPASVRQGQMTETVSSSTGCARGLATIKQRPPEPLYELTTTRVPGWQCDATRSKSASRSCTHEIREEDGVEGLAQRELLTRRDLEPQARGALTRERHHPRADVDADADGRFQRGKQVSGARADLDHPLPARDLEPCDLLEQPVIGLVTAAPGGLGGGEGVEVPPQFGVVVLGSGRVAGLVGGTPLNRRHAGTIPAADCPFAGRR